MTDITCYLVNHSNLGIECDQGIREEISDYFTFFAPGYRFMQSYRRRQWDGKIRLFNKQTRNLPAGLYERLRKFAADRNYTLQIKDSRYGIPQSRASVVEESFMHKLKDFVKSLDLPYELYDHQWFSVVESITNKRMVLLSPTGSGKSLIIYVLIRWHLANNDNNVLLVVPSTSLVEQMRSDFVEYGWSDDEIHCIYSGKEKLTNKRLIISTWQSIYKLGVPWFEDFGMVIGDECHMFKAKSLSTLMAKPRNANYRIGTTGTLDGTKVHRLVLEGLFGPVKRMATTKELQQKELLSELEILMFYLNYSNASRIDANKNYKKYHEELDWICTNEQRNNFIKNLSCSLTGNTLVLFQYVEKHGSVLFEKIKASKEKDVYYVHGGVDTTDREKIRQIVDKKKNAIVVASYGTFQQGINIKNIHNIVFASPSKSIVRVLQSIGRGLRLSDDGIHTKLYDFADDLSFMGEKNHTLKHAGIRMEIYTKEEFPCKIEKLEMK